MNHELSRILERRSAVVAKANQIAKADDLSQEELATLESLVQELKNLDSRVQALESKVAEDSSADQGEDLDPTVSRHLASRQQTNRRITPVSISGGLPVNTETTDLALRAFLRCGTANERPGDQALALRSGATNPGMFEFRTGLTSDAATGNSLVPITLSKNYVQYLKYACSWLDFCQVMATDSGEPIVIPVATDAYDATANAEGWTGQLVPSTDQDPKFAEIELDAYTVQSGLVNTSWELVQDSGIDLGGILGQIMGDRIGRNLDLAFATGDGNAKPTGVVGSVAAENDVESSASGGIAADDLLSLIGRLNSAYSASPKAAFVMSPSTMIQLRKLKASGTGEYLFSTSPMDGGPERIFGYPVYLSSSIPAIAAGNRSVIFGDFSRYCIRQAKAVTVRKSDDFRFSQRQTTWLAYARFDAKVTDPHAFAALKIKS